MCVCVCVCVYSSTPHPLGANSSNGSRKSLRKCCGRKKEKNRKEKKKQEKIETREREREGNSFGGLRRLENFVLGPLERQRPQINFCFFAAAAAAAAAAGGEIKKKTPKKGEKERKWPPSHLLLPHHWPFFFDLENSLDGHRILRNNAPFFL